MGGINPAKANKWADEQQRGILNTRMQLAAIIADARAISEALKDATGIDAETRRRIVSARQLLASVKGKEVQR
jgi:hypothetical protein